MKYSIRFNNSELPDMENLTLDQATDYQVENFADFKAGKFKIEKPAPIEVKIKPKVEKKDSVEDFDYDAEKVKYYSTLKASEYSDIRENRKKICFNQEKGFYLRSLKVEDKEYHVSLSQVEEKRTMEIKRLLKEILISRAPSMMMDYYREEVIEHINKIFCKK